MRVAIDLSPLGPGLPLGVARVFGGALDALAARADVELVRLAPPPAAARGARRAAWRQVALPREAARAGADLVHTFVSAFPVRAGRPVVATVHELPWRRGERENAGPTHRAWAALAARRAARVVCPSPAVAAELGPRARVVPWGLSAVFHAQAPAAVEAPVPAGPYVLSVGGGRAKKRLDLLVAARRRAGAPWTIVVTGAPPAPLPAGVVAVGRVADVELAALYRGAAAVCVLARSEGFAFPVLEAFASGAAVVVPAGSVQAVTAGGLADEVPADDVGALSACLDARAAGGSTDAERAARRAHAAGATWDRTAAALAALWREVLDA